MASKTFKVSFKGLQYRLLELRWSPRLRVCSAAMTGGSEAFNVSELKNIRDAMGHIIRNMRCVHTPPDEQKENDDLTSWANGNYISVSRGSLLSAASLIAKLELYDHENIQRPQICLKLDALIASRRDIANVITELQLHKKMLQDEFAPPPGWESHWGSF